jgi:serine/threonine protein kinase
VYSFGVLAYQILTGELPFQGHDLVDLLTRRASLDAPNLTKLAPECSSELAKIIDCALARDYRKRFQDGVALVSALNSSGTLAQAAA